MSKKGIIKIVANDDYPFENSYNRVTYWYEVHELIVDNTLVTLYGCVRDLIERGIDGVNYEIESDTLHNEGYCQVLVNKHFDDVKELVFSSSNVESFEWIEPLA